jgi:hypothetical protein
MPIRHYLDYNTVFEPDAIKAMSEALELACAALHVTRSTSMVRFMTGKSSQHASSILHVAA